jgi:predicted phage baseplate assembly protein
VRSGPASGNLVRVRHGASAGAALGGGDAARAGQRFTTPDAPIASDLDDAGTPVSSLELTVDGLGWAERASLYGTGSEGVYVTRLGTDGALTLEFGDGERGARLPTGRNNVAATYRVGGGTVGEVESGAIETLLGSIRGVKRISGAGPTTGGADQDDERDLRRLVPTRARAFDRAVSIEDLADLSLGYPGVSHATAWSGQGPPGCACGSSGLHVAVLRFGTSGPRAPEGAELGQLAAYLDARRDISIPLCVCGGIVTTLVVTAAVAVDPRQEPASVSSSAQALLLDPDGPLAARDRLLGQALDRSDVYSVLHGVSGVVGATSLDVPGAGELGRRAAERYELLVLDGTSTVTGAAA